MFKYSTIIYTKEGMCMQVQAINNQSFGGNTKEAGSKRRANIDAAIALSDNDLRRVAYYQACLQTNEEKHNKINKIAILSLPVIAAARDAILSRGNDVKLFTGKIVSSPAARALAGGKTFAIWVFFVFRRKITKIQTLCKRTALYGTGCFICLSCRS